MSGQFHTVDEYVDEIMSRKPVVTTEETESLSIDDEPPPRQYRNLAEYVDEIMSQKPINIQMNEELMEIFNNDFIDEPRQCRKLNSISNSDVNTHPIFFGIYNPNDFPVTIAPKLCGMCLLRPVVIEPETYSSLTNDYPMVLDNLKWNRFEFEVVDIPKATINLVLRYGDWRSKFPKDATILWGFGLLERSNMWLGSRRSDQIDKIATEQPNHRWFEFIQQHIKKIYNLEATNSMFIRQVHEYNDFLK
jgi:hypothetical protein